MAKWEEKNETGSSNSMAGENLGGVWRNTKFGRLSGHPQAVTGASLREDTAMAGRFVNLCHSHATFISGGGQG